MSKKRSYLITIPKSPTSMLTMEVLRVIIDDDETVGEGDNDGLKKHSYP